MEWIDISVPIRPGMISFPGDPVVLMDRPIAIAAPRFESLSERREKFRLTRVFAPTYCEIETQKLRPERKLRRAF